MRSLLRRASGPVAGLALAGLCPAAGIATAADEDHPVWQDRRRISAVMFAGYDTGSGRFGSAGFRRRVRGSIDASGFTLMSTIGLGEDVQRDRSMPDGRKRTLTLQSRGFVGYQHVGESMGWAVHVGTEEVRSHERPSDRLRRNAGLAAAFDIWMKPSPGVFTEISLVAGTARESLWARGAAGFALPSTVPALRKAHWGPEVIMYVDDGSRFGRIGLHAGPLTLWRLHLSTSLGWHVPDDGRHGLYWTIGGYLKI